MKILEPKIRFIEGGGLVTQYVKFSILQEYTRKTSYDEVLGKHYDFVLDNHWIEVMISRDLKGKYELTDGSHGTF
mgnify:FL=1